MNVLKFRMWDGEKLTYMNEDESLDSFFLHANIKASIFDKTVIFEQFTGVIGKSEKEIYEGDRMKTMEGECVIEWQDGSFICCYENRNYHLSSLNRLSFEVIGSIHNKEESK